MKITMIKEAGGILRPASDMELERLNKFKTGCHYEIEIKLYRNPQFHGKVFAFFNYCYDFWRGDREFMDDTGQFDVFRKNLTVNAGYYDQYFNIKGEVRVEAKSLSFANMEQEEFEQCYLALTQAAMKSLFQGCDENTYNNLLSFF